MPFSKISIPRSAAAVTKSDTVADPAGPFRAVWIDTAGNVKVTFKGQPSMSTGFTFAVAANTRFEGEIERVWSTGTTAGVTNGFL